MDLSGCPEHPTTARLAGALGNVKANTTKMLLCSLNLEPGKLPQNRTIVSTRGCRKSGVAVTSTWTLADLLTVHPGATCSPGNRPTGHPPHATDTRIHQLGPPVMALVVGAFSDVHYQGPPGWPVVMLPPK